MNIDGFITELSTLIRPRDGKVVSAWDMISFISCDFHSVPLTMKQAKCNYNVTKSYPGMYNWADESSGNS